jgi:hypothetical protein
MSSRKVVMDAASAAGKSNVTCNQEVDQSASAGGEQKPLFATPLPRPKRRPRRAKADRGLPPDEELGKLAAAYLERQRRLWPKVTAAGLLPEPQSEIVQ